MTQAGARSIWPVLDDPYFQLALTFAKGAARHAGVQNLSALLLVVGLQLARGSAKSELPRSVADRWEDIERAAARLGLAAGDKIKPLKQATFPLDQKLKRILGSAGASLETLVPALLEAVASPEAADDKALDMTVAYATAIAGQYGLSEISPEAFAAAAFAAWRDGRFRDRPAVAAHIAGNKNCFEALITEKGWVIGGLAASDEKLFPLGHEVKAAIESEDGDNKLIAAINVGMKIGAKLLSERQTAYHEAGHAVISSTLRGELSVTEVTIIEKDDALGMTAYDSSSPYWERLTRENFKNNICVALAGRAAEQVRFGKDQIDCGASSDLKQATRIAWDAIACFGLDHEFGPIDLSILAKATGQTSGWLFDRAQQRLQEVLKEASDRAEKILRSNWTQVEAVVAVLLEKQKLTGDEFIASLIEKGLASLPGVRRARKRVVERDVSFARTPGVLKTLEGPVRYDAGDALVVGEKGEKWPVKQHHFDKIYEPVEATKPGMDGRYHGIVREVRALQLKEARRLDLPDGRGVLHGVTGGWLVDYGDGDMSIVAEDVFAATYELLDTAAE